MRLRFWLGFAVAAAIAIGSLAMALVVDRRERDNFARVQRGEATRAARQAEAVAALSVGQLAGAAAFYQVADGLSRTDFETVARPLLEGEALSGTALALAVPSERRAQFEQARGYPIVERAPLGFRRTDRRERHYPVVFAASETELTPPLGYDLAGDRLRARHLMRARDRGGSAATAVMHLPIGGTGINVFHPVYRDGAPPATVAQRRRAVTGFVVGSFRLPDLTEAATEALDDDVALQFVEGSRTIAGPELDRGESATAALRIADRTWLLVVRDPDRPGVSLPLLIAVVGLSLAALVASLVLVWSRSERMQELQRLAGQDPLTGLKNRRRFAEDLGAELARSRRDRSHGAVLMLDLDNFKQVNDTLGHPAGDRTIADIAGVLRARMRATDVVARLGGDEFALVLPHCEPDEAESVARAIATAIREHTPPGEAVPPITASIGIAPFGPQNGGYDEVLSAADTAMYEAKRNGRDSVRVAPQPSVRAGS